MSWLRHYVPSVLKRVLDVDGADEAEELFLALFPTAPETRLNVSPVRFARSWICLDGSADGSYYAVRHGAHREPTSLRFRFRRWFSFVSLRYSVVPARPLFSFSYFTVPSLGPSRIFVSNVQFVRVLELL